MGKFCAYLGAGTLSHQVYFRPIVLMVGVRRTTKPVQGIFEGMPKELPIEDFFEQKARDGEGQFAIAYALLDINRTHKKIATALERLGNNNASTDMGAIEMLSASVKSVAEAIELSNAHMSE